MWERSQVTNKNIGWRLQQQMTFDTKTRQNRSFQRWVFLGNQLHWHWQQKTNTKEKQKKNKQKKTALANKTNYSLVWYAFNDLLPGNGAGSILTTPEPTRGWWSILPIIMAMLYTILSNTTVQCIAQIQRVLMLLLPCLATLTTHSIAHLLHVYFELYKWH